MGRRRQRRSSLAILLRSAETSLRRPLGSVMNKTIQLPGSGVSRHEYVSIGIYNHPYALPVGCKPYREAAAAAADATTNRTAGACDGISNATPSRSDAPGQNANVAVISRGGVHAASSRG